MKCLFRTSLFQTRTVERVSSWLATLLFLGWLSSCSLFLDSYWNARDEASSGKVRRSEAKHMVTLAIFAKGASCPGAPLGPLLFETSLVLVASGCDSQDTGPSAIRSCKSEHAYIDSSAVYGCIAAINGLTCKGLEPMSQERISVKWSCDGAFGVSGMYVLLSERHPG